MASKRSSSAPPLSLSTSQALQHAIAIGIAIFAIAVRAVISWRTHYTADDALIALRYAENIGADRGFVYIPGDHRLGLPGPFYALLLSLFTSNSPHLSAILVGKAFNIAADGVTCYLVARLFARKELARPVEGLFAAALYAFASTAIRVSISGMDTGLLSCVGFAMVYAYVARRPYWLYSLGGVLLLLNINGLLLFAILAAALAIRERKLPMRAGAIALVITIPWLIFATAYFGSPIPVALPSTIVADRQLSTSTGLDLARSHLSQFVAQFASGWVSCALILLFALGAILVAAQAAKRAERGVMAAPLCWCLASFGMMLFSPAALSPWRISTLGPVFIAVACLAGATAPIKFGKMRPDLAAKWAGPAVPAALALLVVLGSMHLQGVTFELGESQELPVPTQSNSNSRIEQPIKPHLIESGRRSLPKGRISGSSFPEAVKSNP